MSTSLTSSTSKIAVPRVEASRDLVVYGRPKAGATTAANWLRKLVGPQVAVVDGITQLETAQRLREEDYALIEVRAGRALRRDRARLQRGAVLASKRPWVDDVGPDYIVDNDGDQDWLIEQLLSIVNKEASRT